MTTFLATLRTMTPEKKQELQVEADRLARKWERAKIKRQGSKKRFDAAIKELRELSGRA